jgi:hypothetical protein
MTYLYVPWTAVNSAFSLMGLPAPNASAFPPVNFTSFMEAKDKPNVTVTEDEIAMTCMFLVLPFLFKRVLLIFYPSSQMVGQWRISLFQLPSG